MALQQKLQQALKTMQTKLQELEHNSEEYELHIQEEMLDSLAEYYSYVQTILHETPDAHIENLHSQMADCEARISALKAKLN